MENVEPPASRVPTVGAGTLVKSEQLGFPPIPGVQAPKAGNYIELFGDWTNPKHRSARPMLRWLPMWTRTAMKSPGFDCRESQRRWQLIPVGIFTRILILKASFATGKAFMCRSPKPGWSATPRAIRVVLGRALRRSRGLRQARQRSRRESAEGTFTVRGRRRADDRSSEK